MTYMFAVQLMGALVLLSGVIALIGNRIGRYFGKKRLSLFGLRPRHTATFFTVVSGVLIMSLTFFTLIVASRDVRIALFGMESLRASIRESREEIKKAQAELKTNVLELERSGRELASAREEKERIEALRDMLRSEVEAQRSEEVVFRADQVLHVGLIKGERGVKETEGSLRSVLNDIVAVARGQMVRDVDVEQNDYDSTVSYIANMKGDVVLRVVSKSNVIAGQDLAVRLRVSPNRFVFSDGEEITRGDISGKLAQEEVEDRIHALIAAARGEALNKGVFPDIYGSLGSVPYSEVFNASRRIRYFGSLVRVSILADGDIYSIGPLKVRIRAEL